MRTYLFLILSIATLWGCQPSGDPKYVSLEEVKYINFSPQYEDLNEISANIHEIGFRDIKVVGDSLIVLNHGRDWSIHSADGIKSYGHCLSIGQGPDEFLCIPYVGTALFEMAQDSLWAYIPDEYNKRIMAFNVSEFIKNGNQILRPTIKSNLLSSSIWTVIPYSNKEFMMLEPTDNLHGFRRIITQGDTIVELPITKTLSKHIVDKGATDINLISAVVQYVPCVDKFVEAMVYLNQINIYSRDGLSGATICVGGKLDNLAKVENTPRNNRVWTYYNIFGNKLGFGAVYSGYIQQSLSKKSDIQIFNWNLEPVYHVILPYEVDAAEIDLSNKRLWVIDKDEDVLRCYDATPIIKAYEKNTQS